MWSTRSWLWQIVCGLSLCLAPLLGACSKKTPEQELQALRAQYTAELSSFTIEQEPVIVQEAVATTVEATEGEGEIEEVVAEEMTAVTTNVVLDILLSTEALESLPGVTVDFSHVDGARNEKDHRLLWIETSQLLRGSGSQITYVVEDVDYEEGDGFAVEIRAPIPADEQGRYTEFDGL